MSLENNNENSTSNESRNRDIENKAEKNKLFFVSFLIILLLFALYIFTQKQPTLKSYENKEENVYTLLEISDEDFLNKIKFGKASEIQQMINSGANVNSVDSKGRNAFSIASIFNGKPEVAQVLKNGGVNINSQDANGYTPLMLSVLSGGNSYPFVNELLKLGASVKINTKSGISILSVAAGSTADERIIEALIKNGADINYKNKDGSTALLVASKITTNPKVIETLLKHGAKASAKDLGVSAYSVALTNRELAKDEKIMAKLKKLK